MMTSSLKTQKHIRKCISTRTALRNITKLPSSVGIGGVAPSVGFAVRVTTVVVWKGGEPVFMWCLRRPSLAGFTGFSFIPRPRVIASICCLDTIYKGMNSKAVSHE